MGLDTKYRPRIFADVLGQEDAVSVLRGFVKNKTGFHQSYLFCGGFGSGKTTLGRILARALLCDAPVDGNPCDKCGSCLAILDQGSSECFIEFDAATNSSKEDIKQITSDAQYDTYSGKRRIYLIDECHRLSTAALDGLLKPMEDPIPGTDDKRLVCIFCTTEPDKMKNTIFSRCAPAFVIRVVTPEKIADRLEYVCLQEGILYEREALVLIAEAAESHIRDALKSLEGVAQTGTVTLESVTSYLKLNLIPKYLSILDKLGTDLPGVLSLLAEMQEAVSPSTCYERLAEAALMAFTCDKGGKKIPVYWRPATVAALGRSQGGFLLSVANTLASRPSRVSYGMLSCDLCTLHYQRGGTLQPEAVVAAPETVRKEIAPVTQTAPVLSGKVNININPSNDSKPYLTSSGIYIDPKAVNKSAQKETAPPTKTEPSPTPVLAVDEFENSLAAALEGLIDNGNRST